MRCFRGLLPGRTYLVKGGPSTGKITLAIQFIMAGIETGEKCLYITLEQSPKSLKKDMVRFGFDLNHPNLTLIDARPGVAERSAFILDSFHTKLAQNFEGMINGVSELLHSGEYSRVAIDPITMMKITLKDELDYRRLFLKIHRGPRPLQCHRTVYRGAYFNGH
jgi:KaiC/GvpD/RAD55 family RecA-like ATPase